jgi:hypothetical protein
MEPHRTDHSGMSSKRMTLLAAVTGVLLVQPSLAQAGWGPPMPVSGSGEDAYALGVAANERDRAAVLFQKRRHGRWTVALRRTDRNGRLGAPTVVLRGKHQVEGGGIFAGRGSDLVAGWLEIINGSRRPVVATGSHLQRRQVLAPGPRSTQILRMDGNRRGDAVVGFWRYDAGSYSSYSIYAAYRHAGHRFATPERIVSGNVSFSSAAMGEDGSAVIGWIDSAGVHVAVRRAGAASFDPPALVAAMSHLRGDPGVAIDNGHVVVSWTAEDLDGNRTVLVSERSGAGAFSAPLALSEPGVRLPHWLTPSVLVTARRTSVAWVQGKQFTTAHDVAALATKKTDGSWGAPSLRGVKAPAHVYSVDILAPAPGRPALLGISTSQHFNFRPATSTLRAGGGLGPVRIPATGGSGGFRPYMAQGGRHSWLTTEHDIGHDRLQRRQVLLFRSN